MHKEFFAVNYYTYNETEKIKARFNGNEKIRSNGVYIHCWERNVRPAC